MMTWSTWPDDQRAATEVPRNSGILEAHRVGATIVRAAEQAEWGGTSGAFADLDGYVWEVAHNPGWRLGEDGSVQM